MGLYAVLHPGGRGIFKTSLRLPTEGLPPDPIPWDGATHSGTGGHLDYCHTGRDGTVIPNNAQQMELTTTLHFHWTLM